MWSRPGERCPCDQTPCAWWVYSWRPAGAPICSLCTHGDKHLNTHCRQIRDYFFEDFLSLIRGETLTNRCLRAEELVRIFYDVKTNVFDNRWSPTCPELVISACVHGGGLERLRHWALARMSRMWVRNLSLALRVVDEHEAVLLVNAKGVWPAVRVVRAAVHWPRGSCSGRRTLKVY